MTALIKPGEGHWATTVARASEDEGHLEDNLRGYINWVEDQLLELPQTEIPVEHDLVDGLYIRTMFAPAGTVLVGYRHKKAGMTVFSAGQISVLTEQGCAYMEAPSVFTSGAGSRRLGYCHTDVVWSSVHAVNGTTLEEIEDELFEVG